MFAADRASWQNPRILVLLLLIFLCGALAGALTMRAGLHEKLHRGTSYWRDSKTQFLSYDKLRKDSRPSWTILRSITKTSKPKWKMFAPPVRTGSCSCSPHRNASALSNCAISSRSSSTNALAFQSEHFYCILAEHGVILKSDTWIDLGFARAGLTNCNHDKKC